MKRYEHMHLSCVSATLALITVQAGQMTMALLLVQICSSLKIRGVWVFS